MRPLKHVKTDWSADLAYCIGLIASDGNLSKDGRHITFVSKDIDQVQTFMNCLRLSNLIGHHSNGSAIKKFHYRVQFGDVNFYRFLVSIGLTPNKSKTIGKLLIPSEYFRDFLRGSFDGDGCFYSYFDKRWKSSFMFYIVFLSASIKHVNWIRENIRKHLGVAGHLVGSGKNRVYQIKYAKKESLKIIQFMYYSPALPRLERKYRKVYNALDIEQKNNDARVL